MELKRGISIGIIFYLVSFTIGGILSLGFGFNNEDFTIPFVIVSIISMILLTVIFSYWYFKKENITKGLKEGFKLGLIFFLVGTILDLILLGVSIFFLNVESSTITSYYYSPLFIISVVSLMLSATITGAIIKKYSKN